MFLSHASHALPSGPPNKVLHIGNLLSDIDSAGLNLYFSEIYDLLDAQPGLVRVKILLNRNQIGAYALAYYETIEAATIAMERLKNEKTPGTQRPLEATYATLPKKGLATPLEDGSERRDRISGKERPRIDAFLPEWAPNTKGPGLLGDKPLPVVTSDSGRSGLLGDRLPPVNTSNAKGPGLLGGKPPPSINYRIRGIARASGLSGDNPPYAWNSKPPAGPSIPKHTPPLPQVNLPKWLPNAKGPGLLGDKEPVTNFNSNSNGSVSFDRGEKLKNKLSIRVMRGMEESSHAIPYDSAAIEPKRAKQEEQEKKCNEEGLHKAKQNEEREWKEKELKEAKQKEEREKVRNEKLTEAQFQEVKNETTKQREIKFIQEKPQKLKEFLTRHAQGSNRHTLEAGQREELREVIVKEEGQVEKGFERNAIQEPRERAVSEFEAEERNLQDIKAAAPGRNLTHEEGEKKLKAMGKIGNPIPRKENIQHGQGANARHTDRSQVIIEKNPAQKAVEAPYAQEVIYTKETTNTTTAESCSSGVSNSGHIEITVSIDGGMSDMSKTIAEEDTVTEDDWDDAF